MWGRCARFKRVNAPLSLLSATALAGSDGKTSVAGSRITPHVPGLVWDVWMVM